MAKKESWLDIFKRLLRLAFEVEAQVEQSDGSSSCGGENCPHHEECHISTREVEQDREDEDGNIVGTEWVDEEYECEYCNYYDMEEPDCDDCTHWNECHSGNDGERERKEIADSLRPVFGKDGHMDWHKGKPVNDVKSDGSLHEGIPGGVEVTTWAMPWSWEKVHGLLSQIDEAIMDVGGHTDEECGGHIHLMLAHHPYNSARHNVPKAIAYGMANLFYEYWAALTWLTSGGTDGSAHRGTCYQKWLDDKSQYMRWLFREKYLGLSFCNSSTSDNVVRKFHLEWRQPDGMLVPVAQTAFAGLLMAMALHCADHYDRYGKAFDPEVGGKLLSISVYDQLRACTFGENKTTNDACELQAMSLLQLLDKHIVGLDRSGKLRKVLWSLVEKPVAMYGSQHGASVNLDRLV